MELIVNERIDNNFELMQKVRLKHIVKISKGKKSTEVSLSNLRYIQIGDLRNDDNLKYAEQNKSNVLCTKNDILIAWDGANAGIIGYNLEGAVGSTLAKLVINDNYKIFPNFLGRFLQTKSKSLRDNCTGATIPHISKSELENIEIPLPDLSTQQKIAEILDTADQLRQFNKQLIEKYDALTQSLFLEMFGDPVRNEKGFLLKSLKEFGSSRLGKMLDGKKIIGNNLKPYLRNSNVQWFRFQLDNLLQMDFNENDKREFSLNSGDVLMCEGGEIGRCAIWKDEIGDCYFQKAIHRIRLNDKYVLPEYFVYMFKKISDNGGLDEFKSAATISHLTGEKLKKMRMPIPPINLQNQFAERVQMIETQKQQAQEALEKSEDLFQSLLQRAFKGELV
jgi:type I restriction enzyme S subunit